MKTSKLLLLSLIAVLGLACEREELRPEASSGTFGDSPVDTRSASPYTMHMEGLLRRPDGTGGEYVTFPPVAVNTLANTPTYKQFSVDLLTGGGPAMTPDKLRYTQLERMMEQYMEGDFEVDGNLLRFPFQGAEHEVALPTELVEALEPPTRLESPFADQYVGGATAFQQNLERMVSLGHEVIDLGAEVKVVAEMPLLSNAGEGVMRTETYIDKQTQRPVRCLMINGEEVVMELSFAGQYQDIRDVRVATFMDGMEVLRSSFGN